MVEDKFKYNIVKESSVETYEELPKHFLADTPEEAEELYSKFCYLLNAVSYSYSTQTHIAKSDLFGEALIGLARAKRDFDPQRSSKFKTFAIYKMKSAMNEYVRKNATSTAIPAYIRHAHRQITLLQDLCALGAEELHSSAKADEPDLSKMHSVWAKKKAVELFSNLQKAAIRAGISTEEIVRRAEFTANDVRYDDYLDPDDVEDDTESRLQAALFVEDIKTVMTDRELLIAERIMDGMSLREIGGELSISHNAVRNDLIKLKKRLRDRGITTSL